jgi:hypothetical protein
VKLTARLRVAEDAVKQRVPASTARSVFDRIDELTALHLEQPPTLSPELAAGIIAAIEREEQAASLQLC